MRVSAALRLLTPRPPPIGQALLRVALRSVIHISMRARTYRHMKPVDPDDDEEPKPAGWSLLFLLVDAHTRFCKNC